MTLRAYVIHLARATERAPQVAQLLRDAPCPTEVLLATDARAAPPEARRFCTGSLHAPRYPFAVTLGEIACFLSHRAAWQQIVQSDTPGLVYEDDTALDPLVHRTAVEVALPHLADLGMIMLQPRSINGPAALIAPGPPPLSRPQIPPVRLNATLYSVAAAARLLACTERFDRPVDGITQMPWVTGIWPAIVQPSGVSEASATLGGTTIQAKPKSIAAWLHRELHRPLYRASIARHMRRYRDAQG